jgi:hypothetical protein
MNLLTSKPNVRYEASVYSLNPHYLAHEDEPVDHYLKYKDSDFFPIKGGRNLQNLFHDSDFKDYNWFRIARRRLSKSQ